MVEEREGFLEIALKPAQREAAAVGLHERAHAGGELEPLLTELLGGVFVGAEFVDPAEREREFLVHARAHGELEREGEAFVDVIFRGKKRDAVGQRGDMKVFLKIGINRTVFGFDGQEFEIASELGKFLVDGHGRDGRLHGLHDVLRLALALVDDHVVVAVVLLREFGDLLLRDLLHRVDIVQLVDQRTPLDERVVQHVRGGGGVLGDRDERHALVVHDRAGEPVGELAAFELFEFAEDQVACLFERLALRRFRRENMQQIVAHGVDAAGFGHHLAWQFQVQLHDAAQVVVQNVVDHLQHDLRVAVRLEPERQLNALGVGSEDFRGADGFDGLFAADASALAEDPAGFLLFGCVGAEHAEILADGAHGLLIIEVAGQDDRHVRGLVILEEEERDVAHGRTLQVFRQPEDVAAVGMRLEKLFAERGGSAASVVVLGTVELLVDGFEFGVESAERDGGEADGFEVEILVERVGRDVVDVDRLVVSGPGVGVGRAEAAHERPVFIVGVFGRLAGDLVDLAVDGGALFGVGLLAVLVEQLRELAEQRGFLFPVQRRQHAVALEHHVFEVVGEAGRGFRVVGAADTHGDQ